VGVPARHVRRRFSEDLPGRFGTDRHDHDPLPCRTSRRTSPVTPKRAGTRAHPRRTAAEIGDHTQPWLDPEGFSTPREQLVRRPFRGPDLDDKLDLARQLPGRFSPGPAMTSIPGDLTRLIPFS
jgi:hypothetical protein